MKIDHLTLRYYEKYYYLNIVFSFDPSDVELDRHEFKSQFLRECEEYSYVSVMETIEDYQKYHNGISIEVGEEPDERGLYSVEVHNSYDKRPQAMVKHEFPHIYYLEKFDKFRYSEYVEINEITLGAAKMLSNIEKLETEYVGPDTLLRIIKTLELFWD